jgi:hypothetical protein
MTKHRRKYDGISLMTVWNYLNDEEKTYLISVLNVHSKLNDCHLGMLPLVSISTALNALARANSHHSLWAHSFDTKALSIRGVIKHALKKDKRKHYHEHDPRLSKYS